MADFAYNIFAKQLLDGDIDLNAPDDIRVLLFESKSDVNKDDADVAAVLARGGTTELTSTNYGRVSLANEATSQDDANDRAEFDADDAVFSNLVQATSETITGYLVFKFVTNDAGSIPLVQGDISPAITPNGDLTMQWDAQGIIQLASA